MLPQAKPNLLELEGQQTSFQAQSIIEVTISEDPRKFLMMPEEPGSPSSLVLIHKELDFCAWMEVVEVEVGT